ncbi:hypothetical protein I6E74_06810 [Salinibacterium sp. SWN139]|uniref:hypothetical protein n=1 Tax=Salinibacterium sp. SWN139 TaxID=2792055 RepID=UPI0018CFDA45|nr:hypothetical protein [Salinibacterium sp. SWN139]MBH0053879.1 hypothetical protein [Salinibacterium sp. SWN139]
MFWDRLDSFNIMENLGMLSTMPLLAPILTVLLLVAYGLFRRFSRGKGQLGSRTDHALTSPAEYGFERRALGIGAIAVIVLYFVEFVVRGYVFNFYNTVDWWRYATPLIAAGLTLGVLLLHIVRQRTAAAPAHPVVATARRTWLSFGPRVGIIGIGALVAAFVATTLAAGAASSPDDRGRYIYIALDAANTTLDPLRFWFYGWAYGIPVIICVGALAVMTWWALSANALRPFRMPEAPGLEQGARTQIAAGITSLTSAAMLLALGGAFKLINNARGPWGLTIEGENRSEPYEVTWHYANLAAAAGFISPLLEVTGFMLLIFAARRLLRTQPSQQPSEKTVTDEVVR